MSGKAEIGSPVKEAVFSADLPSNEMPPFQYGNPGPRGRSHSQRARQLYERVRCMSICCMSACCMIRQCLGKCTGRATGSRSQECNVDCGTSSYRTIHVDRFDIALRRQCSNDPSASSVGGLLVCQSSSSHLRALVSFRTAHSEQNS
jgi:hypothetical protein